MPERICGPRCQAFLQTREQRLQTQEVRRQVELGLLKKEALTGLEGMCSALNGRTVRSGAACKVSDKAVR